MLGSEIDARYRLKGPLGAGSSGDVWEATDRESAESVAIKILRPDLLDSDLARERFLRETASARLVDHPHCVRVRAHGRLGDGRYYLVMDHLRGRTLATALEAGPFPPLRALRIVAQILDGLTEIHALGIVHCDLKPANIMLVDERGDNDSIKILDLGLAALVPTDDSANDRSTGVKVSTAEQRTVCGTPGYMAPEQVLGRPLDARTDLYAVGVILFEMMVGALPFQGRSAAAILSLQVSTSPPRPSALRPELGIFPPLETLILRALSKNSAERPSSAAVFRADLMQLAADYQKAERNHRRTRSTAETDTLPAAPSIIESGFPRRMNSRMAAMMVSGLVGALLTTVIATSFVRSPPVMVASVQPVAIGLEKGTIEKPVREDHGGMRPGRDLPTGPDPAIVDSRVAVRRAPKQSAITRKISPPTQRPTEAQLPSRLPTPEESLEHAEELLVSGAVDKACAAGEAIVTRAPQEAAAHAFLGRCYMRLGLAARARLSYETYLHLAPDAPDAPFVHAIVDRGVR